MTKAAVARRRALKRWDDKTNRSKYTPVNSYSTSFVLTENPISEGGVWLGGSADGLDFKNVKTASGNACATGFNSTYDDSLAVIKSSICNPGADQYVIGTVYLDPTYSPSNSPEIELLLRGEITAHNAPLYEITLPWNASNGQVVYQHGAIGVFDVLTTSGAGYNPLQTGDQVRAQIIGSVITVAVAQTVANGGDGIFHDAMSVTNSSITTGRPGMGFFISTTGATAGDELKYCWQGWECGPA